MSQYLSQTLSQQLRMEQRLTPRLIQSMQVLQKPVADLEAYVEDMLESNAALDLAEPQAPEEDGADPPQPHDEANGSEPSRFARLDRFSRQHNLDWLDGGPRKPRRSWDGEPDAKLGAMANAPDHSESLQEYLLNQWALLDLDDEARRAGQAIINKLDPDGYLRVPLEQMARDARPPLSTAALEQALPLVQRLEPAGIAARDIKECLLLQLKALPGDNRIERELVESHLEDITQNRLPQIARETKYSVGEINEAIKAMRSTLYLHPGYLIGDRSAPPIRPDVIVDYSDVGGGLEVRLARGNSPHLKIREDVAALAKSKEDGETREFAKRHLEEAAALIDAIEFRKGRLLEVTRSIVEKQRDFFDEGPSALRVLRMGEMADELHCDASTISRTVADKYLQTPRGIYPLRYFFTGGTEKDLGESVGWDRIKNRVRELIESEDPKNPLQDDMIASRLAAEGIDISRRTIAKYRQQNGLPSARHRRRFD